jgi:hypothetical protein
MEFISQRIPKLVHGHLCGPIMPTTLGGKKLFLLLVNDFSRYMWVALLPMKDCMLEAIKRIKIEVEATLGKKLSCLRIDHGGKFNSTDFNEPCAKAGVQHQLTVPSEGTEPSDRRRPVLSHCIGWCGFRSPF